MTVPDQIRAAYRASGLTQEEIAYRAGVSSKTLWNILAGRNTEAENLYAVCAVLGVSSLTIPPQQGAS